MVSYTELTKQSNRAYIIDSNGKTININLIQTFSTEHNKSIVVHESATGDGAIVYDMGRIQEEVPVSGELLGWTQNLYNNNKDTNQSKIIRDKNTLLGLFETGGVITFISRYLDSGYRTNKFSIKNLKFGVGGGESMPFTMILTEDRKSNVKEIAAKLVNYADAIATKKHFEEVVRNREKQLKDKDNKTAEEEAEEEKLSAILAMTATGAIIGSAAGPIGAIIGGLTFGVAGVFGMSFITGEKYEE